MQLTDLKDDDTNHCAVGRTGEDGVRQPWSRAGAPRCRELAPSARASLKPGKWTFLAEFGLTLALCGGALIGLPFLDHKDNRARTALFAICIVLTWRYILWRFTDTLPPLALRFESLYAWGFSLTEALACLGWTFGFITLSRTKSRSDEATRPTELAGRIDAPPAYRCAYHNL